MELLINTEPIEDYDSFTFLDTNPPLAILADQTGADYMKIV